MVEEGACIGLNDLGLESRVGGEQLYGTRVSIVVFVGNLVGQLSHDRSHMVSCHM